MILGIVQNDWFHVCVLFLIYTFTYTDDGSTEFPLVELIHIDLSVHRALHLII